MFDWVRRDLDKAARATGKGITVLWHWAILVLAVAGVLGAARMALHTGSIATDSGPAEATLWWAITAVLGLLTLVFVREVVWRVVALRGRRTRPPAR